MEGSCLKRARKTFDGRALCRGHSAWYSKCGLLRAYPMPAEGPPSAHSSLGRWVEAQKTLLDSSSATSSLSPRQKTWLQLIPSWAQSRWEWRKQCKHQRASECAELEKMREQDIDFVDATNCIAVIQRDFELLNFSREDVLEPTLPHTKVTSHDLATRTSRGGLIVPSFLQLPLPLGGVYQRITTLPSDFTRVEDEAAMDAIFAHGADLGCTPVAYSIAALYEYPRHAHRKPWRPLTFEDFARLYPAQSILLLYFSQMSPGAVAGQQMAFASYLIGIEFVGAIWLPDSRVRPHLGTTVSNAQICFDSACRIPGGHSEACRRHNLCVCGLDEAEARATMRAAHLCCWRQHARTCIQTTTVS